MTRSALAAALLAFAPCFLVGSLLRADREQQPEQTTDADFVWLSDLAEARELAAREKKPLLIAFRCVP